MLVRTSAGLHCPAGGFTIDPVRAVRRAVVTHAHSDHARAGSAAYWASAEGERFLRHRIGQDIALTSLRWGQSVRLGDARVSLHPAGHVRGSAQVRVEVDGEVWVVTGDYKRRADGTCTAFEPVPCDTLISEATFALPVFRWPSTEDVVREISDWWDACRAAGKNAVLSCYALGKAQRVLAELARWRDDTVYLHGAVVELTELYRSEGVRMVPTERVPLANERPRRKLTGELVIAPPSAFRSPWMRRLQPYSTGFASGWMQLRGNRRNRGYDRGFVLSDHIDWDDLMRTIRDTGASQVLLTHGDTRAAVRYLRERGVDAADLAERLPMAEDARCDA